MKTFKLTYFFEGSVEKVIEANNEEEAVSKMDEFFMSIEIPNGDLSPVESDIEEIK